MVSQFPALTQSEFAQACHALQQYWHEYATGDTWTEVKWSGSDLTILEQHTLQKTLQQDPVAVSDYEPDNLEEDDPETLHREFSACPEVAVIQFSVTLSPSYQVPVLWFRMKRPHFTQQESLDFIFRCVVVRGSRAALTETGVLGGISIAHHPVDDMPAFFVHPCQTQEALSAVNLDRDISPIEYLMMWFGIIAAAVGLTVSTEVAATISYDRLKSAT